MDGAFLGVEAPFRAPPGAETGFRAPSAAEADFRAPPAAEADFRAQPHAEVGRWTAARPATALALRDVSLSFGGVRALKGVSLDVRPGEIRAIIGCNFRHGNSS